MLSGKFVSATKEYAAFDNLTPSPYFRKSFDLKELPLKAQIDICGLGFYELYINGTRITKGYLAPYISNPDDVLYYDHYDLSDFLQLGENVIGIQLGNGMLNCPGGEIWDFEKAVFRSAPKVALHFHAEFSDGSAMSFEADESLKTAPSPIYFDDLRAGEFYDARKEIPNWNLPGFDDGNWRSAIPAETPRGEKVICPAEPIVITKELSPVEIRKAKISQFPKYRDTLPVMPVPADEAITEGWLYDFGVNAAGLCRLKINGKPGQKIVMQFGELLDNDGNLDLRGMPFLPEAFNHRDIYICKGGSETYMPSFTYHGFRYCLVLGIDDDQAADDLLTYAVMNSDLRELSDFSCSDEMVNKLQNATLVSDLANFYYFPTDCPHREKNGWTADSALSAEQMLLNLSAENSLREWLRNIRKAQREDGAMPGIIPTTGWGFHWGNGPAWDCVIVYLPFYIFKYRGNTDIIHENASMIMRYLNYMISKADDKGLLHFGLGDWCHAGMESGCKAPLELTDTIMGIDICQKASLLFEAAGLELQKGFADSIYVKLYTAARAHLIDTDTFTALGNCQTSQAMAIYYGIFTEEEKPKAFGKLVELIEEQDNLLDVGVLGARVIFHVLSQFGKSKLAYQMITTDRFPSYAYWINNGQTSLCETFRRTELLPDSHNHHFFGDISSWFIQNLAGIRINPKITDCSHVVIAPSFIDELTFVNCKCETVNGDVHIKWSRDANTIILDCDIPKGCHGKICLGEGFLLGTNDTGLDFSDGLKKTLIIKAFKD